MLEKYLWKLCYQVGLTLGHLSDDIPVGAGDNFSPSYTTEVCTTPGPLENWPTCLGRGSVNLEIDSMNGAALGSFFFSDRGMQGLRGSSDHTLRILPCTSFSYCISMEVNLQWCFTVAKCCLLGTYSTPLPPELKEKMKLKCLHV